MFSGQQKFQVAGAGFIRLVLVLFCCSWPGICLPVLAASFEEVEQLLTRYCADCHVGAEAEGGLTVETLSAATAQTTDREPGPAGAAGPVGPLGYFLRL